MRKSTEIVKEIKGKGFKFEDKEFKELSAELHLALTYERNHPQLVEVKPTAKKETKSKED